MKLNHSITASLFFWFLSCSQIPFHGGSSSSVEKKVLGNGLTVVVTPMKNTQNVAVVARVKVGFFDEEERLSGLSHLLEHMYFKGTERRPGPEDVAQETKFLGGSLNAWTFHEETVFHVVLPSDQLERAIDIHADALLHPLVKEDQLKKEIEVVLQEGRRRMDMPSVYTWEKMKDLAFTKHRVNRWLIGSDQGLRKLLRADVLKFHENYYRPNNIILSIAGRVSPSDVFALVEKYYGVAQAAEVKRNVGPSEPPQTELRYKETAGDINLAQASLAFHTVPRHHPDERALSVLAALLTHGRGSRLIQDLQQKKQWVSNIHARQSSTGEVGWFEVGFEGENRGRFDDVVAAVLAHVQDIQFHGVIPSELRRAKMVLAKSWVDQHDDPVQVAEASADAEHFKELEDYIHYPRRLDEITSEQVQMVARKYFSVSNLSVMEYVPQKQAMKRNVATYRHHLDRILAGKGIKIATPTVLVVDAKHPQIPLAELEHTASGSFDVRQPLPIKVHKLPNGMQWTTVSRHQGPTVNVLISIRGGRVEEGEKTSGWSACVADLLTRGPRQLTQGEFATQLESAGVDLAPYVSTDDFGVAIDSLSISWNQAVDVAWQALLDPAFRKEDIEATKKRRLSAILASRDDGLTNAINLFRTIAFNGHPYSLPSTGKEDAIRGASPADLRKWYDDHVHPENIRIIVVGDVDESDVEKKLSQLDFPKKGRVREAFPRAAWPDKGEHERIQSANRQQTSLVVGFPTAGSRNLSEQLKLEMIASITGGLGGRFFSRVRGEANLAYTVFSLNLLMPSGGGLLVYTAMSPENERKAWDLLQDEMKKIVNNGFTQKEWDRARNHLSAQYRARLEDDADLAEEILIHWNFGRDFVDYPTYKATLDGITLEDLKATAANVFLVERSRRGIYRGRILH